MSITEIFNRQPVQFHSNKQIYIFFWIFARTQYVCVTRNIPGVTYSSDSKNVYRANE